jgi:hypothetical protein
MLRRCLGLLLLALLVAPWPAASIPSGVTVQVGSPLLGVAETSVNNAGRVVYRWGTGAGSSGLSTWSPTTGDGIVAQRGQPAPGGFAYSSFGFELVVDAVGPFLVNDAGQVAFKNAVQGAGAGSLADGSNNAIWGPGAGGGLSLLARYGQTLPGDGSGGVVTSVPSGLPNVPASILRSPISLDDAGRTTFATSFQVGTGGTTAANDVVLYRSDGAGGGSILAREGGAAPGKAPGTTYTGFQPFESHAGTGFVASTNTGSVIYGEDGVGGFTPLVSSGDAAPGTGGAVFSSLTAPFNTPRIDGDGDLIFRGTLQSGGGVTTANDTGYWGPSGLIAREGDQAPGAPPGATLGSFVGVDVGDHGIVFRTALFGGGVTSANNTGLWQFGDDGSGILLAREGDAVPGLAGAVFADFGNEVVATNAHEESAFTAGFAVGSGGVTSADDRALFFADATGALTLLLREGEFFPTLGTLRDMALEPGGLNDAGQLLVRGTFSQGGPLTVTAFMLVTVPEPSTALLLGLGLALLTRRARARARA